jgi:hypothetical protein
MNLRGLFRSRDKPQNAVSASPAFYFGSSGAGKSVTARSAIQVSSVYASMSMKTQTPAAQKRWAIRCISFSMTSRTEK